VITPEWRTISNQVLNALPYYSIYGLAVLTNRAVPSLSEVPGPHEPDLLVRFGSLPDYWQRIPEDQQQLWHTSEYLDETDHPVLKVWRATETGDFRFAYSDAVEFVVSKSGSSIWAAWPDTFPIEYITGYLLGPVIGFALRNRGTICLHASAFAVDDRAVLLVGASGSGKSSAAASLAQRGFPILSDDIVALRYVNHRRLMASPGYPFLRLWPDAVESLFGSVRALPRAGPEWFKCPLDLLGKHYKFQSSPLEVGAIYVLGRRSSRPVVPCVERMSDRSALISLISNTYAGNLIEKSSRSLEFEQLSECIANIPVHQLTAHSSAALLPRLCETILDHYYSFSHAERAERVVENANLNFSEQSTY
jgi:hypothetical protein